MTDRTIEWVFRATDKTSQAFRSVDSKLAGITKSLRTFAGFAGFAAVAAGIGTLTRDLVQMGSELQDASDKLGVNAEALQSLKFAAEQTGSSFDALQTALAFNTKLTAEAARGGKAAAEAFRLLGIDAKKFEQIPIDRRLAVIAEQISKVDDPAKRLDLTIKALGRSGADLAPLMAEGAAGLAKFDAQLKATNSILSNEQVKALDEAGDAWEAFILRLKVGAAPVLTGTIALIGRMVDGLKALNEGRLYITNQGFEISADPNKTKGPTGSRRGGSGLATTERATVTAAAATARSDEQIAAATKIAEDNAKLAAKAQKLLADAASKTAEEVLNVTTQIAALSKEAATSFESRGKDLSQQFEAPLDTLKTKVAEVNALFAAGLLGDDAVGVANRAIQQYGDDYANSMDRVIDKNAEVKDSTSELLIDIKNAADGFARDLTDVFFDTTNSIGDMFSKLAETIAKALFTQAVSQPLIDSIFGAFGGAFGGGRASGGPVGAGKTYMVGERGPELFVPGASGTIIPNGEGGGMTPVQVSMTITSVDPQTAAQTIAQQERLITGMIRKATLRAGRRPVMA